MKCSTPSFTSARPRSSPSPGSSIRITHGEMVGNVTIATNMAGRGTDIKLTTETTKAGGLHVIGTERHTARRIDNQLRGAVRPAGRSRAPAGFTSACRTI